MQTLARMVKDTTKTALPSEVGKATSEFIDQNEFLRRIPISRRTLATWRFSGKIPYVALTGRRILFHWPSVEAALLRAQRNAE